MRKQLTYGVKIKRSNQPKSVLLNGRLAGHYRPTFLPPQNTPKTVPFCCPTTRDFDLVDFQQDVNDILKHGAF